MSLSLCTHYLDLHVHWKRSITKIEPLVQAYIASGVETDLQKVRAKQEEVAQIREAFLEECGFVEYQKHHISKPEYVIIQELEAAGIKININAYLNNLDSISFTTNDIGISLVNTLLQKCSMLLKNIYYVSFNNSKIDSPIYFPKNTQSVSFGFCNFTAPPTFPEHTKSVTMRFCKGIHTVLSFPIHTKEIDLSHSDIHVLPKELPPQLEKLDCSNTPITSLPPIPESVTELRFENCPNLTTITNIPDNNNCHVYYRGSKKLSEQSKEIIRLWSQRRGFVGEPHFSK